jgi:glyoxylase-like metal-dependent hydrolase (beta-lactamase superfamily II)
MTMHEPSGAATGSLAYDVFMNEPPSGRRSGAAEAAQGAGLLPNGEPKGGSPVASTLILGSRDAVLTDPGFTIEQAGRLGDWVAGKDRNVTDIFITHGHGDHWFAAGLLAERFGARVVATAGSIAQMEAAIAARPFLWDKVYPGIPPSPITAVTVPNDRFTLEDHDLVIVEAGHADTQDNSVLHVPDLELVVAGDVIYNGAHLYLGESVLVGGLGPWRDAIATVESLEPRHIVCGHQNHQLDDDAQRTIAETRKYLDDAEQLMETEPTAIDFFNAMVERYPNHIARTVLWATARSLYGVRENPDEDVAQLLFAAWQ